MHRAVLAVIVGGFAFWGIGTGLGQQPGIFGASLTADARPAITSAGLDVAVAPIKKALSGPAGKENYKTGKRTKIATTAGKAVTKLIKYDGLEVSVPASWPVYWLNQDPNRCIRYDQNAVYVGTPGANQDCPAGLIGRNDTISIGAPAASGSAPAKADRRASIEGKPVAAPSLAPGTIVQNPSLHEFAVAMPVASPSVDATYGTDPDLVEQTLATIRQVKPQSAPLGRPKEEKDPVQVSHPVAAKKPENTPAAPSFPAPSFPAPSFPAPSFPAPSFPAPSFPTPSFPTPSFPTPAPTPTPTPTPAPTAPDSAQAGFDTCTAPSLTTMEAWRAKYSATTIYIGGQMMACDYGDLSASWVGQAEAMGWSLMPTFVGLQAPCNSFSGKINPSQAAAQGTTAANQAIANATSFGMGAGTPIYYDMEAYDDTNAGCRTAVLTFLDAWDRQLTATGYVSGVYSSAGSGITDLQSTTMIAGHALAEPQALWFALWDNSTNLSGSPYLSASVWPVADRSKQYAGNQTVRVGGISLNIDEDWVASAVATG